MSAPSRVPDRLYHYTCLHGRQALGAVGILLPLRQQERLDPFRAKTMPGTLRWLLDVVWLTDLEVPDREGLGLTSTTLACDRTEFRYVVSTVPDIVEHWPVWARRTLTRPQRLIEESDGAMPMHWYVAPGPVASHLDDLGQQVQPYPGRGRPYDR